MTNGRPWAAGDEVRASIGGPPSGGPPLRCERRFVSTVQCGTHRGSATVERSPRYGAMPSAPDRRRSSSTRSLTEYDFGPAHPMSPIRVDLTMRLADELGVLDHGLRIVPAPIADDDLIATVHDPRLIEAVTRAGTDAGRLDDGARARHRRQPGLPRHAPRGRPRGRRERRGVPTGLDRRDACTRPTSPAACTTRCPTGPAASASTTTSRSASSGCSTRAPSGSPTSTSTSTTATASSGSSGTTRGC